jgi:uncharacterized protein YegP (UPF0339 family)
MRFEIYSLDGSDLFQITSTGRAPTSSLTHWHWRLRAANGIVLVKSDGFASKEACLSNIERVKQITPATPVIEL